MNRRPKATVGQEWNIMSEYSIIGLTVIQKVLYLQVFICLPMYAYLWGEIQCEEMTVVVSAVIGSMLTRISC